MSRMALSSDTSSTTSRTFVTKASASLAFMPEARATKVAVSTSTLPVASLMRRIRSAAAFLASEDLGVKFLMRLYS